MLKPSTAIACLALFISLAGGAYAGAQSLIGSKQIANHSIQLIDISPRAAKALRGARGLRGPRGFQGPQGLPGSQGSQGAPGVNGAPGGFDPAKIVYVTGPDVVLHPGDTGSAAANCPAGTTAISGGFFSSIAQIGFSETFGATFHGIAASNDTSIDVSIHATVVCSAR